MSRLSSAQLDRAIGVLLGTAAGDALGAPYEFHPPRPALESIGMVGGGTFGWERGEWTDDTSMALVIAQVAAAGGDLASAAAQDQIGNAWHAWAQKAPDVGSQTREVLAAANHAAREALTPMRAEHLRAAALEHHQRSGRSGGNGSLMRTAPVALAYLHDEDTLFEVAQALSRLTHQDLEAAEACALWCLAIRHAVLTGSLNVRRGLARLSETRREVWRARIDAAERLRPSDFTNNGWVVEAFQAAWSAIAHTTVPVDRTYRAEHFAQGVELAARGGYDTDTVAAIAGGLLGAAHGGSSVPASWRRLLHGWPGLRVRDLTHLAVLITLEGHNSGGQWPTQPRVDYSSHGLGQITGLSMITEHPYDAEVLIGGVGALSQLPFGVEAVVSLCRLGREEVPADLIAVEDHVEMWIIDSDARVANPNLEFVLDDAARLIAQLRDEGKKVFLHGVTAAGPAAEVAARYGATRRDVPVEQALDDVTAALRSVLAV